MSHPSKQTGINPKPKPPSTPLRPGNNAASARPLWPADNNRKRTPVPEANPPGPKTRRPDPNPVPATTTPIQRYPDSIYFPPRPTSSATTTTPLRPADNKKWPADKKKWPADNKEWPADNKKRTPVSEANTPGPQTRRPTPNLAVPTTPSGIDQWNSTPATATTQPYPGPLHIPPVRSGNSARPHSTHSAQPSNSTHQQKQQEHALHYWVHNQKRPVKLCEDHNDALPSSHSNLRQTATPIPPQGFKCGVPLCNSKAVRTENITQEEFAKLKQKR